MKFSVVGTVDANSPVGRIMSADWENRTLMGENLSHTTTHYNMEDVRI